MSMDEVSRRTVLGGALAGVTAAALPVTPAVAGPAPDGPVPDGAAPDGAGHGGGWIADRIDWAGFLGGSDLVWQHMPTTWYEGPFLGNGFLGSGIYAEPGANAIRFNVQHSEVQDHRPEFGSLYGLARLPIGWFTLEPQGTITKVDWRLSLYDAELAGTITTTAGSIAIRAIVHNGLSTLAVQAKATDGEAKFRWVFHPAVAVSPRTDPKFN